MRLGFRASDFLGSLTKSFIVLGWTPRLLTYLIKIRRTTIGFFICKSI